LSLKHKNIDAFARAHTHKASQFVALIINPEALKGLKKLEKGSNKAQKVQICSKTFKFLKRAQKDSKKLKIAQKGSK
jgi:hypothetical protein